MKSPYGIPLLLLMLLVFTDCGRSKEGPSQNPDGYGSGQSSAVSARNLDTPRDSVIQSYFSDEYSIHIFARVTGSDFLPFQENMWMIIYNSNGQTLMSIDADWYPDLEHGVNPLEPEWPDYFLVHVYNLGNCCTCTADYLLKVTADEIKIIGEVNDYIDGKFYVNICDWPPMGSHGQMTLTKHEVPLINDTLHYPDGYNI